MDVSVLLPDAEEITKRLEEIYADADSNLAAKAEVKRRYAKYIFLDVVRFSERSAEAQSEIVVNLNELVGVSMPSPIEELKQNTLFIPTGDGMCIAFLNPELAHDVHIQTAFNILESIHYYNAGMDDETRKFQVRIGINQNTDILITDINNRTNVAGAGINLAARIMDKADGGQLLVSDVVYAELQPREKYRDKFRRFGTTDKNGASFQVFQFIGEGFKGLNIDIPSGFQEKQETEPELDKRTAYYFAIAIQHKKILLESKDEFRFIQHKAIIAFWILSLEAAMASNKGPLDSEESWWKLSKKPFAEQIQHLGDLDFNIVVEFANLISVHFKKYQKYFERTSQDVLNFIPNERGIAKLKKEWPSIWTHFRLSELLDGEKEGSPE